MLAFNARLTRTTTASIQLGARKERLCVCKVRLVPSSAMPRSASKPKHTQNRTHAAVQALASLYIYTPAQASLIATSANDTNQHDHWCDRVGFHKSMFVNQTSIIYDVHRLIVRVEKMGER